MVRKDIKTFDDVLIHLNKTFIIHDGEALDETAYRKLKLITMCFNGNWCPDWCDSNEYKYYPWFDMRSTGASHGSGRATTESSVGFVFVLTLTDFTHSAVGSRLCFKNEDDCVYAAKTFIDIYYDFFVWNVRFENINNILK